MKQLVVLGALGLLGACGGSSEEAHSSWQFLAEAYADQVERSALPARGTLSLPRSSFRRLRDSDIWMVPFSQAGWILEGEGEARPRLYSDDLALEYVRPGQAKPKQLSPGTFTLAFGSLHLCLTEDQLPEQWTFEAPRDTGAPSRGRWRIQSEGRTTDGFLVTPDQPVELPAPGSGPRLLSFATSNDVLFEQGAGLREPARVLVRDDDRVVYEAEVLTPPGPAGAVRHHLVRLPPAPGNTRLLRFEVAGPAGLYGIHQPVVRPETAPPGSPERPRDVFLFLADTFRADSMETYDGTHEVTPVLDQLAAESMVFRHAWSTSTWTLPAHSSLFFGVYPYQHGVVEPTDRPGGRLVSLAERFRQAGYRTAAVTDSAFVSARFDMDQGFEWFRELRPMDLAGTRREIESILDHGDGRPLFLFVQSYQPHAPYRFGQDTRQQVGPRLGLPDSDESLSRLFQELRQELVLPEGMESAEELVGGLDFLPRYLRHPDIERQFVELARRAGAEALADGGYTMVARWQYLRYLCAVHDFDRALGEWLDLLAERGLRERGILVFTSDHGEFFGEHDQWQHHEGVWDEVLRIPLLLSAAELPAGRRDDAVSLVDLAPTLARLAGVEADPEWQGRDLLAEGAADSDEPVFAFDCPKNGDPHAIAVRLPFKLVWKAEVEQARTGTLRHAYELLGDPQEQVDLVSQDGALQRLQPQVRHLQEAVAEKMRPMQEARSVGLDEDLIQQLKALGYAVDGTDHR